MEDINRLFTDLKEKVELFYQKNADLDASGMIQMEPILRATKKLDLYLSGDFEGLWRMECEELQNLKDEMEEMLEFKTQEMCSEDEVAVLRRELAIMTRCAKRMMDNYKKAQAGKIDGPAPLDASTSNHVQLFPYPLHQRPEEPGEGRCRDDQ